MVLLQKVEMVEQEVLLLLYHLQPLLVVAEVATMVVAVAAEDPAVVVMVEVQVQDALDLLILAVVAEVLVTLFLTQVVQQMHMLVELVDREKL